MLRQAMLDNIGVVVATVIMVVLALTIVSIKVIKKIMTIAISVRINIQF